ncbi:unnamed protein product, partial [Timema podura]|nr:unnamed protein product [Timema podura]
TSLCLKGRHREVCTEDDLVGEFSFFLVAILFFSQFVLGIGWTLFQTLGQTYLDDNTDKKKTPFMISIASSLRQLGPALGSYLTSACLKLYIDLSVTPVIDMKDPRWIGAWWLGWMILGFIILIISIVMSMFPKEIVTKKGKKRVKVTHLVEIKPKQYKSPSEEKPLNRCENTLKILAPAEVSVLRLDRPVKI